MRVIGIDPGSRYTGYGVVEKCGSTISYVASGRINATKALDFAERLVVIYEGVCSVFEDNACDAAAIESIFTARNAMSSLKLGHARGVAILALRQAGLPIAEYAPATVKLAVVGHGRAKKDDVKMMVKSILGVRARLSEDAADALAVAVCHCQSADFHRRLRSE